MSTNQRILSCWAGQVTVTISDVFNWNGIGKGIYEVVAFGDKHGIYSPSGLGGTSTVWVRNKHGLLEEWCGDSVASGILHGKIDNKPTTP